MIGTYIGKQQSPLAKCKRSQQLDTLLYAQEVESLPLSIQNKTSAIWSQFSTWDLLQGAQTAFWPTPLEVVFEVEADRERAEPGESTQDAVNKLHRRDVREDIAHTHHVKAAVIVARQGPEPRQDAEDIST